MNDSKAVHNSTRLNVSGYFCYFWKIPAATSVDRQVVVIESYDDEVDDARSVLVEH